MGRREEERVSARRRGGGALSRQKEGGRLIYSDCERWWEAAEGGGVMDAGQGGRRHARVWRALANRTHRAALRFSLKDIPPPSLLTKLPMAAQGGATLRVSPGPGHRPFVNPPPFDFSCALCTETYSRVPSCEVRAHSACNPPELLGLTFLRVAFATQPVTLPCGHTFCRGCATAWFTSYGKMCPQCRSAETKGIKNASDHLEPISLLTILQACASDVQQHDSQPGGPAPRLLPLRTAPDTRRGLGAGSAGVRGGAAPGGHRGSARGYLPLRLRPAGALKGAPLRVDGLRRSHFLSGLLPVFHVSLVCCFSGTRNRGECVFACLCARARAAVRAARSHVVIIVWRSVLSSLALGVQLTQLPSARPSRQSMSGPGPERRFPQPGHRQWIAPPSDLSCSLCEEKYSRDSSREVRAAPACGP